MSSNGLAFAFGPGRVFAEFADGRGQHCYAHVTQRTGRRTLKAGSECAHHGHLPCMLWFQQCVTASMTGDTQHPDT